MCVLDRIVHDLQRAMHMEAEIFKKWNGEKKIRILKLGVDKHDQCRSFAGHSQQHTLQNVYTLKDLVLHTEYTKIIE